MSEFQALLDELTLLKAMPAGGGDTDDKTIQAAAADGNPDADGDGKNDVSGEPDGDEGKGGAEDEVFGKSFQVQLEDGSTVDAFDGTEMMKALWAANAALKVTVAKQADDATTLGKSLQVATDLIKSLQGTVTQLQSDIARIGNTGAGRKTTVNVHEKPTGAPLAKSESIAPQEFLAKCETAFNAGKLSGRDLARAEAYIGRGATPPAEIVNAVIGA